MLFQNSANAIHKQFSSASINVFILNQLRTVEYSLYLLWFSEFYRPPLLAVASQCQSSVFVQQDAKVSIHTASGEATQLVQLTEEKIKQDISRT
jgi:hypothetical protein